MKTRQKVGAGLALAVVMAGASLVAQANMEAPAAVAGMKSAMDIALPAEYGLSGGIMKVAAVSGSHRRHGRFRGNRNRFHSSGSIAGNAGFSAGSRRFHGRFRGNRNRFHSSGSVAGNAGLNTGSHRRAFRFRSHHRGR